MLLATQTVVVVDARGEELAYLKTRRSSGYKEKKGMPSAQTAAGEPREAVGSCWMAFTLVPPSTNGSSEDIAARFTLVATHMLAMSVVVKH